MLCSRYCHKASPIGHKLKYVDVNTIMSEVESNWRTRRL